MNAVTEVSNAIASCVAAFLIAITPWSGWRQQRFVGAFFAVLGKYPLPEQATARSKPFDLLTLCSTIQRKAECFSSAALAEGSTDPFFPAGWYRSARL
jgi:hypothetical protein